MNDLVPRVGVGVLVARKVNGQKELLLHQRKGSHGKNYWGSGGGHLELGESLRAAAIREMKEEAGENLKFKIVKLLGIVNFTEFQPKHYVDISFLGEWESGEAQNTEPEKMSEWQWFKIDSLPSPLFPPVEKYLEFIRNGSNFYDSSFK